MDILLKSHSLTAVCAPHAAAEEAAILIAGLARQGPVTVLDCGNRFAAYRLMQELRLRLPNPMPAILRVYVRRAFTCYQVQTLLGGTPSRAQPHILLDLLSTFYDENVSLPEAHRLLESCLRQVERLNQAGPVLVTLAPPPIAERADLVERVYAAAHTLYSLELPITQELQPTLF